MKWWASVLIMAFLAGLAGACRESATTPSPQPAASVTFVPGTTFAPGTAGVRDGRVVIAYVGDGASESQVSSLGARIASLPQVRRYAFMDKDAMLDFFRETVGDAGSDDETMPLPQGFWLLLREADSAAAVAAALADEPALKHDGSAFSGVRPARELYEWVSGGD